MRPPFPPSLTEGYRAFLDDRFVREQDRYASLAEGQSPEILIISCCDSRVSPEVIFDAAGRIVRGAQRRQPGPAFETGGEYHGTSAALEFAVQALKVKHIVVLGHARCGGVRAYADDAAPLSPGDFIGRWVSLIRPAAEALGNEPRGPDYLEQLEFATVTNSLRNLMTFPCVKILVERGKLQLHGAHFGIATGQLRIRDPRRRVPPRRADRAAGRPS